MIKSAFPLSQVEQYRAIVLLTSARQLRRLSKKDRKTYNAGTWEDWDKQVYQFMDELIVKMTSNDNIS